MVAAWAILQLSEEGEAIPYARIKATIIQYLGDVPVLFPHPIHPKQYCTEPDTSDFPFCSYVFICPKEDGRIFRISSSPFFIGPLFTRQNGTKNLVRIPEQEVQSICRNLRKEQEFFPRLGHFVRFKFGKYRGIPAVVVGKNNGHVHVEARLDSISIAEVIETSSLVPEDTMKINLVIDGMNLVYRAGFALNLCTSKGVPTGVTYGFLRTLIRLKQQLSPKVDNIFIVWDRYPEEKVRKFADYKGHRLSKKQNISLDISNLCHILQCLGVFQVWADKEEADDVIASLIEKELQSDVTYIYSADSDLLQLIDSRVVVFSPDFKHGVDVAWDAEKVKGKFLVFPNAIPLYKSICGDLTDNLKGVPGYGKQKTANLFAFMSMLSPAPTPDNINVLDRGLSKYSEKIRLNYDLIKLKKDIDYNVQYGPFDREQLRESFCSLEFKSFIPKLVDIESNFTSGFFKVG